VYCNFPEIVGVNVAKRRLLRLNGHHIAFILTCKISYLIYISLGRRLKRFDFGRRWNLCKIGRRGLVCFVSRSWLTIVLKSFIFRITGSPGLIKSFVILQHQD
jgi:hypothetical protein